jgi:methylase of polypeptide subunit release factors
MPTASTEQTLSNSIQVDTSRYLRIPHPERLQPQLSIDITGHCFLPRLDDLESDWVAHVAVPAFKVYRRQRGGAAIESFCSIGTGSGLDVLSAIEVLGASRVGLTDVHEDVVAAAVANVARNQRTTDSVEIQSGFGDLLTPLRTYGARYDVIYENLPNIPSQSAEAVIQEKNSSAYVPPRTEALPRLVKQHMLDLHYLALLQAREFLKPGACVLSCLGARVPLDVFLSLGKLAGYTSSILTYGWKVQGYPELIRDYGHNQASGFGPFYFYRAEALQEIFAELDPADTGNNALEIERSLQTRRMDPVTAYAAFEDGERIGHTVAVLKSEAR